MAEVVEREKFKKPLIKRVSEMVEHKQQRSLLFSEMEFICWVSQVLGIESNDLHFFVIIIIIAFKFSLYVDYYI